MLWKSKREREMMIMESVSTPRTPINLSPPIQPWAFSIVQARKGNDGLKIGEKEKENPSFSVLSWSHEEEKLEIETWLMRPWGN